MLNKDKKHIFIKRIRLILTALAVMMLACACTFGGGGDVQDPGVPGYVQTGFVPAVAGNYDSTDTAVVVRKDTEASRITFLNIELGKCYTLDYDGATSYADKYGQGIALAQVDVGEVVDVTFMHSRKRLNSLQVSAEGFAIKGMTGFVTETGGRNININGERYSVAPKAAVILPDGMGDLMDINSADTVRVSGIGHTIYGIALERGHGYLRLENTSAFEGGWLEVGDDIISQISKDMLIAVPEGTYLVRVSKDGVTGEEAMTVAVGAEATMDLSKYQAEALYGGIIFTVSPQTVNVYIDGEKVDISEEIELSYGLHQMVATAKGYETVSRYIRVAEEHAVLNISLEKDDSVSASSAVPSPTPAPSPGTASGNSVSGGSISDNSVSGNEVSGNKATMHTMPTIPPLPDPVKEKPDTDISPSEHPIDVATPGKYRVMIEEPKGAEVYKDGTYIGMAPVSFDKSKGTYIITLRKNGCQTRSYTISVDDEKKDVTYSFSELLPLN
ncbi:MAG: PEGA domain-containing protein [Lachnospiraceae bacterium]|nr:PEGA domain-containing protein [Lachnospiraceae bacterium]